MEPLGILGIQVIFGIGQLSNRRAAASAIRRDTIILTSEDYETVATSS